MPLTPKKNTPPAVSKALRIAQSAVIAAMLLMCKLALRGIANVEVVTVIIIVAAFVFPFPVTGGAVLVFCTVECAFYGFHFWSVSYYIYWPLVALAALPLKLIKNIIFRTVATTAIALFMTALFGVLTAAVDTLFIAGFSDAFFTYFPGYYLVGVWFYVTQFVSNAVIVPVLFPLLTTALKRAGIK